MKFYTNVFSAGDNIYYCGYEDGERFEKVVKYQPYLFIDSPQGTYKNINGSPVGRLDFPNITHAREHIKKYGDVEGYNIYGLDNFPYVFINDEYPGQIEYDPSMVSVVSIDIECISDQGFPDVKEANKEITAITIRKNGYNLVFGCGDFVTSDPKTKYMKCSDERTLLHRFLMAWNDKHIRPDIVTGWNIDFFDIPYLYNRIRRVCGPSYAVKLSPWQMVFERVVVFNGKAQIAYDIKGISSLDYFQIYKKFKFGNQESYKLDYIASVELGEAKIDYSEYGSLIELYKNNFQKFIEYNIHDVVLVDKLEEKLKFIEQIMAFAYDAKVNYIDTMTTVRPWDVIIHNYLMTKKTVIPAFRKQKMAESLVGGYVKNPKLGLSKWVVSFDLDSLYPHLIMQYNISPETYRGKVTDFYTIDELLTLDVNLGEDSQTKNFSVAANGCKFSKEKQGFLATLMETMYNDRKVFKKRMIEANKMFEKTKDPQYSKLATQCHNMQLAKKIQLNSAYGALGNEYFRWFNFDHAEAITTSGQLSIRWIESKINQYMNNLLKTENEDYVIASDTDSIYVNMEKLVETFEEKDEVKIVGVLDNYCETKIQPFIDESYKELAERMNAYQQKMRMKRETIANKGIWKAKKMYILNAWNIEGVQYDKPKLKIQGIEAVRSSTPNVCRTYIKKALEIIMNKNERELQDYVSEIREQYYKLPFEDISFPRGVNNVEKYYDTKTIYKLATPIHVKASLLYNKLITDNKYINLKPINSGDKIKFCYLRMPNIVGDEVVANMDVLPKDLDIEKYIDYEKQFNKSFIEPLKSITDTIDWEVEKKITLERFFK